MFTGIWGYTLGDNLNLELGSIDVTLRVGPDLMILHLDTDRDRDMYGLCGDADGNATSRNKLTLRKLQ